MDTNQRLDALVAPLRADVVSGASVIGKMAAEVLHLAAQDARAVSLEEFRSELGEVCGKVLDAQPAMATLVTLVRDMLTSVEACEDLETGRLAAVRTAEAFESGFESRAESVATRASALIPSGATVATISYSSTVLATLTREGTRAVGQVICFESRPMREGKTLATALAEVGVTVTSGKSPKTFGTPFLRRRWPPRPRESPEGGLEVSFFEHSRALGTPSGLSVALK